jgi:hypothetical protein
MKLPMGTMRRRSQPKLALAAVPRRAGGQQHLLARTLPLVGMHAVRLSRPRPLEPLHAGGGLDLRAAALGRLRQTAGEAAHVHLAAALVQQAADKALARHLGRTRGACRICTSVSTPSATSRSALRVSASRWRGRVASLSLPRRAKSQSMASSRTTRSTASTAAS